MGEVFRLKLKTLCNISLDVAQAFETVIFPVNLLLQEGKLVVMDGIARWGGMGEGEREGELAYERCRGCSSSRLLTYLSSSGP